MHRAVLLAKKDLADHDTLSQSRQTHQFSLTRFPDSVKMDLVLVFYFQTMIWQDISLKFFVWL